MKTYCQLAFWYGVATGVLWAFTSFVPGAGTGFFALSGVLLTFGLAVPSPHIRFAATVGMVLCGVAARNEYVLGLQDGLVSRSAPSSPTELD